MKRPIWTFTDAAEAFGTKANVISGIAKLLKIEPKPTGMPGLSKGLDESDMNKIAGSLGVAFDPNSSRLAVSA